MTVSRVINSTSSLNQTNILETTTDSADPNANQTSEFVQGSSWKYDGTSGPSATKAYHRKISLGAGAATIDLTALVDTDLTIDMTGLKLKEIFLVADSANLNPLTVKPGASNGYTGWGVGTQGLILGTANDEHKLGPMYGGIAVDGTHKTIDLSGTGSEKVFISMLFG